MDNKTSHNPLNDIHPPMSNFRRMKTEFAINHRLHQGETIAMFGAARLVRHLDGRHELVGGTAADQAAAREWISLFEHDIVLGRPYGVRR